MFVVRPGFPIIRSPPAFRSEESNTNVVTPSPIGNTRALCSGGWRSCLVSPLPQPLPLLGAGEMVTYAIGTRGAKTLTVVVPEQRVWGWVGGPFFILFLMNTLLPQLYPPPSLLPPQGPTPAFLDPMMRNGRYATPRLLPPCRGGPHRPYWPYGWWGWNIW